MYLVYVENYSHTCCAKQKTFCSKKETRNEDDNNNILPTVSVLRGREFTIHLYHLLIYTYIYIINRAKRYYNAM